MNTHERATAYNVAIRCINDKLKTLKQPATRKVLKDAKELLANDDAFLLGEEKAGAVVLERRLMAMLAADTPQFNNPLVVAEAQGIRDRILSESAKEKNATL